MDSGNDLRTDLNRWMNRCKIYIHLGGAGQNDRGNLESMLCGCRQIIGMPIYHPPFVYGNPNISQIVDWDKIRTKRCCGCDT